MPGLGKLVEIIFEAFKLSGNDVVKLLGYLESDGVFPMHPDMPKAENRFRVSFCFGDNAPAFAMMFKNANGIFTFARGFMCVIVMDMWAAGRVKAPWSDERVEHGTLVPASKAKVGVTFIVFDATAPTKDFFSEARRLADTR